MTRFDFQNSYHLCCISVPLERLRSNNGIIVAIAFVWDIRVCIERVVNGKHVEIHPEGFILPEFVYLPQFIGEGAAIEKTANTVNGGCILSRNNMTSRAPSLSRVCVYKSHTLIYGTLGCWDTLIVVSTQYCRPKPNVGCPCRPVNSQMIEDPQPPASLRPWRHHSPLRRNVPEAATPSPSCGFRSACVMSDD